MRRAYFFLAVTVLAAGHAGAEEPRLQRGPVPSWVVPSELMPVPQDASGLLFVRRSDSLIHLDRDGEWSHQGYRIRILHPNALQAGNLAVGWNPANGSATIHAVKVHRGATVIDVLESAQFEILRREDQLEAAMLDGVLTAVLRVPDLRVGDELEVGLTIRSKDPNLGSDSAGLLAIAPSPPPGRVRLGLSWDAGQEPKLDMTADMAAVARRREQAVDFSFDNPATIAPPKGAPARYGWQRAVQFSDFPDWAAVSRRFAPLYDAAAKLGVGSPLQEEARRIAAAHGNPLDRAGAALKLVQGEVRYIYVGLDGGNLRPATAEETWKRRYGDCKGKTALLLALLAELGIEAEPVIVNNSGADDGLDVRLPSPAMFDHVLVRAQINGADLWLDGTLPPVAEPSATPIMPYRWFLPLTTGGSSLQRLAWRVPQTPDELTLLEIDAQAGFDQPARISTTTILRGVGGLQQQVQFSSLTPDQLLTTARQHMIGGTFQTIEKTDWRYDTKARASILTVRGTGTVDWDVEEGGKRSLILPGGGFSPPETRVRPSEHDQSLPYLNETGYFCHVTTVRLPKSTQAAQWSFNSTFDTRLFGRNFHRAFELRDHAIRMVRGSRTEAPEIDAATAKRDNARLTSFDNSMALITYDPSSSSSVLRSEKPSPILDEIDWAASDVPCLGSSAGS